MILPIASYIFFLFAKTKIKIFYEVLIYCIYLKTGENHLKIERQNRSWQPLAPEPHSALCSRSSGFKAFFCLGQFFVTSSGDFMKCGRIKQITD